MSQWYRLIEIVRNHGRRPIERFLDMLYTNVMSSLAVGKCRYGLMCSENGFLSDDGVVVRSPQDAPPGEWLRARLAQGTLVVEVVDEEGTGG